MTETTWLIALAIWLICGIGAYLIAAQKGDPSPLVWGAAGLVLGPVGLIASALMASPRVTAPTIERDTRTARLVVVLLVVGTAVAAAGIVAWAALVR